MPKIDRFDEGLNKAARAKDSAYEFLVALPYGISVPIYKIQSSRPDVTRKLIKQFIDEDYGRTRGNFYIEMDDQHLNVRKVKYFEAMRMNSEGRIVYANGRPSPFAFNRNGDLCRKDSAVFFNIKELINKMDELNYGITNEVYSGNGEG